MTRIAILGTGAVARTLAGPLVAAGHPVVFGSRRPAGTVPVAGTTVRAAVDAVAQADVVVNGLPGDVAVEVLAGLPVPAGAVLVDVANAVHTGPDGFAAGLRYPGSSLAEELQAALPTARIVKTLNTMHVSLMAHPGAPVTAFLSGDDVDAKAVTRSLLGDLGWVADQVLDLGGLPTARWVEGFVLAVRPTVRTLGPVPFGLAIAC
ncbi:NADPH-dependent F420 reductase [Cryptosporangium minutisporangium]|uniref:NAD(P)-binding domain-containing protein n=1 Tax=Cryptosporangium minutisporangium TaxID=113569 RepID=A0ABP6SXR4_9ACTN